MAVRVKICGVTTAADAVIVAECGADAVGLNFYPKSPRYLTDERAAAIVRELPPRVMAVGVFVDPTADAVVDAVTRIGLHAAQTYTTDPLPLAVDHIPAFRVKDAADLAGIRRAVDALTAAGRPPVAVLVDSYVPGEMGGTGHRAPWDLLAGFAPGMPVYLAGGLTPDNVADAIRTVRPWGVDVASGVEAAPGRKDPGKVRAFIQAVRAISA